MRWSSTFDLLDAVMSGTRLAPGDLDDMCRCRLKEDEFIDFKDGRWLGSEGAHGIREYTSGFANGGGGMLVVGITDTGDRADKVGGCIAPGGKDAETWAKDALGSIAQSFSPLPQIQRIAHSQGDVLVIATYRSPNLIPCCRDKSGGPVYHYRFGDSTFKAPDYMIADMLLGRRQHPELRLSTFEAAYVGRPPHGLAPLPVSLSAHNDGLSWAPQVKVGIVGWSIQEAGSEINPKLAAYIDVEEPDSGSVNPQLVHAKNTANTPGGEPDIEPFGFRCFMNVGCFLISEHRTREWRAAAYVMARGSPPIWYQLTHRAGLRSIEVARAVGIRPKVVMA